MLQQLLPIARNALVESLRQPIFLLLILLSGFLQVFNTWNTGYSMGYTETGEVSGDDKLLLDIGMSTIFVAAMILAAFIATSVLSREIENKTVLTVVSKPVARPTLIIGKFLGVAAAITIATVVMIVYLLLAIRHGVMSTAADDLDMPVLIFGFGGTFLALALAAWANFFYNWNFPQTAVTLLLPFMLGAYTLVLCINEHWDFQSPAKDFKPQITVASLCLVMAILVLTSIATAASTRLKQVPTVTVCIVVFLLSLLSNHFIGRHVFTNPYVGIIRAAASDDPTKSRFQDPGDTFNIELEQEPVVPIPAGSSFYFGPSPNGSAMLVRDFPPFTGDVTAGGTFIDPKTPFALVITQVKGRELTVRAAGSVADTLILRPPAKGDYVFLNPTKVNVPAFMAWSALPNMQAFWYVDAVSQNNPLTLGHAILVILYGVAQIVVALCLAIILFQGRDVG